MASVGNRSRQRTNRQVKAMADAESRRAWKNAGRGARLKARAWLTELRKLARPTTRSKADSPEVAAVKRQMRNEEKRYRQGRMSLAVLMDVRGRWARVLEAQARG